MHGVSDGKGDDAAHDGGHQADLHRVPDGAHGERVIEHSVEMHERVVPHVEQTGGIGNEQEPAESGHDQSERGQHYDGEQIEQRQGKGEPTPSSKLDDARAKRLTGNGCKAAASEHALLQQHQCPGHRHEDDRDRGGRAVERRRPVGQLENVSGQHRDVGGRAEHGRDAVDAEHHDEGQQHAGDDGGRDQREGDGEQRSDRADACDLRRLLQARIHVAQRRGGEQVDIGGVIHAEHQNESGHGVEIDSPVEPGPRQHGVDEAGPGRAQDRPGDAGDQRGHEQRDQARGGDEASPWRVGAHDDPGKGQSDHDRQRGAAGAGNQQIDQRIVDIGIAENGDEVGEREIEHAEPIHHRIGVGERAKKQHGDGVEDEKSQQHEERARP